MSVIISEILNFIFPKINGNFWEFTNGEGQICNGLVNFLAVLLPHVNIVKISIMTSPDYIGELSNGRSDDNSRLHRSHNSDYMRLAFLSDALNKIFK